MNELEQMRALRAAGQHEAARAALVALAATYPQDPIIQYEAACIHDFLGEERAAVPYYLAAIRNGLTGEALRGAYLGLGSTYRALGAYEAARAILQEGQTHFPEAKELPLFLAMTLYNLGDHHAAMQLLLTLLADTSSATEIQHYARAIRFYAQDLDQSWP